MGLFSNKCLSLVQEDWACGEYWESNQEVLPVTSRLPCYVFRICLLTNIYQKYKSVELGDQLYLTLFHKLLTAHVLDKLMILKSRCMGEILVDQFWDGTTPPRISDIKSLVILVQWSTWDDSWTQDQRPQDRGRRYVLIISFFVESGQKNETTLPRISDI